MPTPTSTPAFHLYAAFIGDGCVYDVTDSDAADTSGYWIGLRLEEVTCPACSADPDVPGCCVCDGSGYVSGEPFEVVRYTFTTEEERAAVVAACEDAGDGYDRAACLPSYGVTVLEWEPDHGEWYTCPCCNRIAAGDKPDSGACPGCEIDDHDAAINRLREEFRAEYDSGDPWGGVMSWLFSLAGELYARGVQAGDFRPGIGDPRGDDPTNRPIVAQSPTSALEQMFRVLDRAADMLRAAHRDY